MKNDLKNIKFRCTSATEKQIDFILDNIEYYQNEQIEKQILEKIGNGTLSKGEATNVISKLIEEIKNEDDFIGSSWYDELY